MKKFQAVSALRSSKGFTLIELMMVVTIIGLLASFGIPRYIGYMEKARIARSIAEIRYFEREIQAYYIDNEKYPDSLLALGRSFNNLVDPWGNQYQYLLIVGTKWARNGGGGGTYYARGSGSSGMVTAAAGSGGGFWSGSWFVSEAWAQASPPTPPTDPGNSGSAGGSPPTDPGNSGNAGGSPPTDPGNSGNAGGGPSAKPRKDRFLVPINSDYDLYSMGPDGQSNEPLTVPVSKDDIIRASDGAYVGVADNF